MISHVLAEAVQEIDRYLNDPVFLDAYQDSILERIQRLRDEMLFLRHELDSTIHSAQQPSRGHDGLAASAGELTGAEVSSPMTTTPHPWTAHVLGQAITVLNTAAPEDLAIPGTNTLTWPLLRAYSHIIKRHPHDVDSTVYLNALRAISSVIDASPGKTWTGLTRDEALAILRQAREQLVGEQ